MRDLTAEILNEVYPQVSIEPTLTALIGEEFRQASVIKTDNDRADLCARSFWIKGQTAYCDVRVFNPLAKCYMHQNLAAAHKRNEAEKKLQYNQRVLQVEPGSFTPLIFSCFGGLSRECNRFFSHAAEQIAKKKEDFQKFSSFLDEVPIKFCFAAIMLTLYTWYKNGNKLQCTK